MLRRMLEAFCRFLESIDQSSFIIETPSVALYLRQLDDGDEDPALVKARAAYNTYLDGLKKRPLVQESMVEAYSKVTQLRKREPRCR